VPPRIGSDESGKGDYFGPLTVAAVFVDEEVATRLAEAGVRDSKRLSAGRVRELAPLIRETAGLAACRVVRLDAPAYNGLQGLCAGKGRSINWLLAWAHARCIEDLLARGHRPQAAVVDQFASPWYLERRLMPRARLLGLQVTQHPRAEADIAVAAASILAREAFLDGLEQASALAGRELPRGASRRVERVASEIAIAGGRPALLRVAKIHFRTTEKALAPISVPARSPRAEQATIGPHKFL
jgi:ribonuclease HIII